jgi:tetratricopeptide (TPR) repeat protein
MTTSTAEDLDPKQAARALLDRALAAHTRGQLDEAEPLYRQVLEKNPQDHNALTNLGTIFLQRGRLGEGIPFLEASLQIKANQANALTNLGNALTTLRRFDEALSACERSVILQPESHDAFNNLGNVLRELGRPEEALTAYDRALALKPDFSVVLNNKGNLLRNLGRLDEALAVLDQAIVFQGGYVEARNEKANVLAEMKQGDAALAAYDQALALNPEFAEAWSNKAVVLQRLKRLDEALAAGERAIALRPDYADALYNTANVLADLKRFDEALSLFDRVIALRPDYGDAYNNRGAALQELKRWDEALADLEKARALSPGLAAVHGNRGNVLRAMGQLDDALAAYRQGVALDPNYLDALNNIGIVLSEMGRAEEALAALDLAIAANPEFPDSRWNKSLLCILTQRYTEGWRLYEWRWRQREWVFGEMPFLEPHWLERANLAGKSLLIRAEQGLGDTLQMLRYMPLLAERGIRVILAVQKPLGDIARRVRGVSQVVVEGEAIPPHDFNCMIMSLPLGFETTVETIPADVPYLSISQDIRDKWAERLGPKTRPRVGLVWSGSTVHKNDGNRSIPLKTVLPLLDANPAVEFFSLQLEYREADQALMAADGRIRSSHTELKSLMDTGGLIEQMDLVISVDTSVAHLAGALGKPLWLLLPWIPDYRWHLEDEHTPWYPTARLFRQPQVNDWPGVVRRLGEEIAARFA